MKSYGCYIQPKDFKNSQNTYRCYPSFVKAGELRVFRSPVKLYTQLQHGIFQSLQTMRAELISRIDTRVVLRLI